MLQDGDTKARHIYLSLLKQNREIPSAFKKINDTALVKNICEHLDNKVLDHEQRSLIFKLIHQAYPFLTNLKKINKAPSDICQNCNMNRDNLMHRFLCTQQSRLISILLIKMVNRITETQSRLSTILNLAFKYNTKRQNHRTLYLAIETIEYILSNGVNATLSDYKELIKTKYTRLNKLDPNLIITLGNLLD